MNDLVPLPASPLLSIPSAQLVPATIAEAGERASWRYVEFFTANISNPNTRRAYARVCGRFFTWCENRGLALTAIRAFDVAAYLESLRDEVAAPSVKQCLAALRMLFDWLVVGQIVPANPASSVRGPKHVVKTGKTSVLDTAEWRRLTGTIPASTVRDLRDRALIATLTYSFARIGAALKMRVEDLRPRGAGWTLRLHEKGGKHHVMPCHHALAEELHAYIAAAGIADDRHGWLFRTSKGKKGATLSVQPMTQADACAHGATPRRGCRYQSSRRLPHIPRHRDNRLSDERRDARARPGHGRAREPTHDQALRSDPRTPHTR
jgi:site-specific recombinase XerD